MTLPQPSPLLSDFLTPEQMQAIARRIDETMDETGNFIIYLEFKRMELRYIRTTDGEEAPRGRPALRPQERKPDGI
jgi:hypothetical protein